MNKKGMSLGEVPNAVIMLVLVGIVLTVGSIILTDLQADQTSGSGAYNASSNSIEGLEEVSSWQSTIGTILGAAVVIGIVVSAFVVYRSVA